MKNLFLSLVFVIHLCSTLALTNQTHHIPLKIIRKDTLLTEMHQLHGTSESGTAISYLFSNRNPPLFVANLSIGEPAVPQLLYVDTGSSFTWIKCRGCNTCDSQFPAYDPKASSTYRRVSCNNSLHKSAPALSPVKSTGECQYLQKYFDGSESTGTLGKETVRFETDDDGVLSVPNVHFGCAQSITNGFGVGSGLLGLAYGKFSIMNQFAERKFSLCFGILSSDSYSGQSYLTLGEEARITGKSTPLFLRYGHYHVNLKIISINGNAIPNHLEQDIKGNTIIDTSTTILNLAGESYTEVKSHIDNLLDGILNSFTHGQLVCYNGTIQGELSLLPTIALMFDNGASLELDPTSLFHQFTDDYFCLAMTKSPEIDLNIIGILALQDYNIGFDLQDETIYFDKISCMYRY